MIKYDNLYYMYNPVDMDYTFIKKGDNMELIELNRSIREAKASYEMAKTDEEEAYYKAILQDLRREKEELLKR